MTDEGTPSEPRTPAAAPAPGWLPPDPRSNRSSKILLGCLIGAAVVFLGLPLLATAILDNAGTNNGTVQSVPSFQSVGFGTGGSECTLTGTAASFPAGTPIRIVASFSPALAAGSSVTISWERDGIQLTSRREIVRFDEPADCIYSQHDALPLGKYRIEYELESSAMPPLAGEFEVTAE
jgi:hypothetical protein